MCVCVCDLLVYVLWPLELLSHSLFLSPFLCLTVNFSTNSQSACACCPFIKQTTMRPLTRLLASAALFCTRLLLLLLLLSLVAFASCHTLPSVYFSPLQDSSRHNVRCKVCLWSSGLCFIYVCVCATTYKKQQQQQQQTGAGAVCWHDTNDHSDLIWHGPGTTAATTTRCPMLPNALQVGANCCIQIVLHVPHLNVGVCMQVCVHRK